MRTQVILTVNSKLATQELFRRICRDNLLLLRVILLLLVITSNYSCQRSRSSVASVAFKGHREHSRLSINFRRENWSVLQTQIQNMNFKVVLSFLRPVCVSRDRNNFCCV